MTIASLSCQPTICLIFQRVAESERACTTHLTRGEPWPHWLKSRVTIEEIACHPLLALAACCIMACFYPWIAMIDMHLTNSRSDLGDLAGVDQLMSLMWIAISSVFSLSRIVRNRIRELTQWIRTIRDNPIRWVRHPSSDIPPHGSE